jgi:hypothetical protein
MKLARLWQARNVMFGLYAVLEGKRINIRHDLYGVTQKQRSRKGFFFSPAHWTQI